MMPREPLAATLPPLPMSSPDLAGDEIGAIAMVLASGCLSVGPQLEEFERRVAALTGAAHAIAVSSGTAGLHLAVIAAGVSDGDIVITTPFSFIASANCVLYERAIPVFADVDPVTGNIDAAEVANVARDLEAGGAARRARLPRRLVAGPPPRRLKALLPVHAFGQPADMDPLLAIGRAHGVPVIEDACEAIGAEYAGQRVGGLGDAGVFAFYPNKQVTTGEGGIVVTNDAPTAALIRSLRNQGRDAMGEWLAHSRLGFNYRMDELSAALGVAQIRRLSQLLERRAAVAAWYTSRLAAIEGVAPPVVVPTTTRMSWFTYVVRLAPDVARDAVMADLREQGIPTRAYFTPIHLQPFYAARFGYRRGQYPVTEALGDTCLALPFSGMLTEADVERVCLALQRAIQRHGSLVHA